MLLALPVRVGAYSLPEFQPSGYTMVSDTGTYSRGVVDLAFVLAFMMAFFYLLFGAISWIISGGDSGKLETARNRMVQAIVGLLVLGSTWAIYSFFMYFTAGGTDVPIPQL